MHNNEVMELLVKKKRKGMLALKMYTRPTKYQTTYLIFYLNHPIKWMKCFVRFESWDLSEFHSCKIT